MPPIDQACVVAFIGLGAGLLGGLAGIGGSLFILPALHIVFGPMLFGEPAGRPEIHHTYMAAAMMVNVAVSLPATLAHHREGVVRTRFLRVMLPAGIIGMLLGVEISNQFGGDALRVALAVFLIVYCVWNLRLIARPRRRKFSGEGRVERSGRLGVASCGFAPGLAGGILGLGGGFLLVPMLQLVCNMKLKNAIATSSAVIVVTSIAGSILKAATLAEHGEHVFTMQWPSVLWLAGLMAPTAMLGGVTGARLLHRIPVVAVRIIITGLILVSATKLLS
ncbi:MAG: sulfite exporter TauE/SafE family protein [Phycisphaerales bacterium]|nr:sulfite exporter TauE/SafE family protein [Phycisphaerales bacterium]